MEGSRSTGGLGRFYVANHEINRLKTAQGWLRLNAPLSRVFEENRGTVAISPPPPLEYGYIVDPQEFCLYHDANRHSTNRCWKLCFCIRDIVIGGGLANYVEVEADQAGPNNAQATQGNVAPHNKEVDEEIYFY